MIAEDLEDHTAEFYSCLDQVRQIVSQGQDVLSEDEIVQLQRNADELKLRFDGCNEQAEKMTKRLTSALEELSKVT